MGKDNKTILKAEKLELMDQTRAGEDNISPLETFVQDKNKIRDRIKSPEGYEYR
jgi:hypothetical protein